MTIIGIVLAVAGALIALASKWIISTSPWDSADKAVVWLKPWAWHLCALGVGMVIGALFS